MNGINLYNCDCMEFMKGVKDKAYDLAIVDVNYGIKEDGRNNHTRGKLCRAADYRERSRYDDTHPPKEYFDELLRVSKNQIIWGANHFISMIPLNSPCWIVWDKVNGDSDFADCEMAWTSFDTAVRKFKFRWSGMLQENMAAKQKRIHPNEKPIPLYKWLLKNYAVSGQLILDTHGGSMSVAIACYDLGFDLDLCELDEYYFKAGLERFDAHVAKYAPASEVPATKKGELKLF
jgi:site-specific DNA-methyltransferase (adenine-specific)